MSLAFTPENLTEIREFADHLQHAAPIPRADGKRLPVRVTLLDAMRGDAVVIDLHPEGDPLITFPEQVQP